MPPEPYSDADDVRGLVDALGLERASFVGSSLGGRVALEIAATYPERVDRLVLLCPAFRGVPPSPAAGRFDKQEAALLEGGQLESAIELNLRT